jgi:hypothetical protein
MPFSIPREDVGAQAHLVLAECGLMPWSISQTAFCEGISAGGYAKCRQGNHREGRPKD